MNPMDNLIRKMNLSTLSIPSVHITDIIDIIIVAIVIYTVIHWIKETRAWSLFRGLMVIALFSLLSYYLDNRKNFFSRRNCRNYNLSAGT